MLFATVGQAWMFLATVYGGVAIGALYDIGRVIRRAARAGRAATACVDTLFWLAAAVCMFITLWRAGAGDLRAYMLLGFACGWGLYEIALSRAVQALFLAARKLLRKAAETPLGSKIFK